MAKSTAISAISTQSDAALFAEMGDHEKQKGIGGESLAPKQALDLKRRQGFIVFESYGFCQGAKGRDVKRVSLSSPTGPKMRN